jgi:hypothetical protein
MLWSKDRTLFSRYFPQNLVFIEYRLAKLDRISGKLCFGGEISFKALKLTIEGAEF